jgi:hypothetical protein
MPMQFDQLNRRDFITLLGGTAMCPLAALLVGGTPSSHGQWFAASIGPIAPIRPNCDCGHRLYFSPFLTLATAAHRVG